MSPKIERARLKSRGGGDQNPPDRPRFDRPVTTIGFHLRFQRAMTNTDLELDDAIRDSSKLSDGSTSPRKPLVRRLLHILND